MKKNPLQILVIEDEPLLLASIVKKIEKEGLHPTSVKSGEEAIKYLEHASPLPDFIWLDYYLGGKMNGLDFMKVCHENPRTQKVPVVVVSNTATQSKVDEMLKLGALKYFLKAENLLADIIDFIKTHA